VLVYQPKVKGDGRFIGMEALHAGIHYHCFFVSPLVFIPIAEKCWLGDLVTQWVNQPCLPANCQRWANSRMMWLRGGHQ